MTPVDSAARPRCDHCGYVLSLRWVKGWFRDRQRWVCLNCDSWTEVA